MNLLDYLLLSLLVFFLVLLCQVAGDSKTADESEEDNETIQSGEKIYEFI